MCNLASKCKEPAKYNVIHKAVGAMPERSVPACKACAAKIGKGSPTGPVIDMPSKETKFYRIEVI